MFLLGQLVSHLESADQSNIAQLVKSGLSAETLQGLRNLTLADTVRFANGYLGISINIDCQELTQQLSRMDRAKADRQQYEAFVRGGASVRLAARLFGVSEIDVRRLRKVLAPETAAGGRPRLPAEDGREDIQAAWRELQQQTGLSERERWWLLASSFTGLSILTLEAVVDEA